MTKPQPYIIERTYNASVSKVWKAITDKDDMKHWYFDLAEFKAEPGFKFQFTAGGNDGIQYVHLCEIKEVVFEKKLSYTWCYEGLQGNSLVTFELFKEADHTRLKLTHEGLETFPQNSKDFAKESFAAGWAHITGISLKNYLEK